MRLIPMSNTHHAKMEELVIGKNLGWLDDLPAVHEPKAEYRRSKNAKKSPGNRLQRTTLRHR
jgi:DNA adenine methylase